MSMLTAFFFREKCRFPEGRNRHSLSAAKPGAQCPSIQHFFTNTRVETSLVQSILPVAERDM
jgi:hypothetical protein